MLSKRLLIQCQFSQSGAARSRAKVRILAGICPSDFPSVMADGVSAIKNARISKETIMKKEFQMLSLNHRAMLYCRMTPKITISAGKNLVGNVARPDSIMR